MQLPLALLLFSIINISLDHPVCHENVIPQTSFSESQRRAKSFINSQHRYHREHFSSL